MAIKRKTASESSDSEPTGTAKPMTQEQKASKRPLWETVVQLGARIPDKEWAKVPDDASINLDHYLYGAPKKSL